MSQTVKKSIKKRGHYQKYTYEQRMEVEILKMLGTPRRKISLLTGINVNTVKSMKLCRKMIYSQFEEALYQEFLPKFIQKTQSFIGLDKRQLKVLIKNSIKEEFCYRTSNYKRYFKGKEESQRQRIYEKVVIELLKRIQQHLLYLDQQKQYALRKYPVSQ